MTMLNALINNLVKVDHSSRITNSGYIFINIYFKNINENYYSRFLPIIFFYTSTEYIRIGNILLI